MAVYTDPCGKAHIRAYRTSSGACRWKQEIAAERWEHDLPGNPRPENPQEMAREYFERMEQACFAIYAELDIND